MGKQYTPYVIVLIVLFSLTIFMNFVGLVISLFGWNALMTLANTSRGHIVFNTIMLCVTIALATIYLLQLIKVKKSLFLWTHIAFGYYVALTLFNLIYNILFSATTQLVLEFTIGIAIISIGAAVAVWITFYKHLLKAKATKIMVFN